MSERDAPFEPRTDTADDPAVCAEPSGSSTRRLIAPQALTIVRAVQHKLWLLDAVTTEAEVELDLSAVTELDSAGVQLLLLSDCVAHERGTRLRLVEPSAEVRDVFRLLGLEEKFMTASGEGVTT